MKTAVSVPDDLYRAAERAGRRLGLTRSRLYARALKEFLLRNDEEEVRRRLDEVYADQASAVDPVVARIARRSLTKES